MALDPEACPVCGKVGMVGREREIVGDRAVTVYKCHHCNNTWRVPDSDWPRQSTPKPVRKPSR